MKPFLFCGDRKQEYKIDRELMQLSKENDAPILVYSTEEANEIYKRSQLKQYDIKIPSPITVHDVTSGGIGGKNITKIVVKNIERFTVEMLQSMGLEFAGGSVTTQDKKTPIAEGSLNDKLNDTRPLMVEELVSSIDNNNYGRAHQILKMLEMGYFITSGN